MKVYLSFLFVFFFTIIHLFAQKADNRVAENLKNLSFKYELQPEDATFKFTVPIGKRTQTIFIESSTSTYDKLEMREVYSIVHQSRNIPDQSRLVKLLMDNAQKKIGAWEIVYEGSEYFIIFTAKIPANADASDMKSAIDIVSASSDGMEQQLFATDEW
ncbi:MAG: hypothetical protein EAZ85_09015 [Bacteroidetes bacterium]|nr:MAG: hypothetical protein EAZ85_09015 [Bacteroidota bacterium]TAG88057.1 MAG: hypothetical protein EAZ20_09350 [Bacteroidota bacterium]